MDKTQEENSGSKQVFGDEKRRLGAFRVSAEFIKDDWKSALKIFQNVVVVRCELVFVSNSFEYMAYSEYFDEIGLDEQVPIYSIIWNHDESGGYPMFLRAT